MDVGWNGKDTNKYYRPLRFIAIMSRDDHVVHSEPGVNQFFYSSSTHGKRYLVDATSRKHIEQTLTTFLYVYERRREIKQKSI